MPDDTPEHQRQAALMSAILSFEAALPTGWRAPAHVAHPMHAHQGHVRVLAAKVLAQTFPTLQQQLPAEVWPELAQAFWQQHPPTSGNLNQWGAALPAWLSQPAWQAWPDLADVARLDWAIHDSQLAPTAEAEPHTLALLGDPLVSPDTLCLQLKPDVRLLPTACVLGTDVQAIADDWYAFMTALHIPHAQGGPAFGPVLEQHLHTYPGFDFAAWLTTALTHGWIWRVRNLAA